jgi:hypothetical protein
VNLYGNPILNPKTDQPTAADLDALAHTNLNVTSARDASQFLSGYPNITLCNTVIYERQVWQKSILEGRSVVERKSNKASNELKLLYGEIFNG